MWWPGRQLARDLCAAERAAADRFERHGLTIAGCFLTPPGGSERSLAGTERKPGDCRR